LVPTPRGPSREAQVRDLTHCAVRVRVPLSLSLCRVVEERSSRCRKSSWAR
jgi:hypothetical protein